MPLRIDELSAFFDSLWSFDGSSSSGEIRDIGVTSEIGRHVIVADRRGRRSECGRWWVYKARRNVLMVAFE